MDPSIVAAQLQEVGNASFVRKDFAHAYEKYTQAIRIDGRNAVLYASRSASSFRMGKYLDAWQDALKATKLGPGYAKGWSLRASTHEVLHEWTSAVNAWKRALNALPQTGLCSEELMQKEFFETSLEKAKQCEVASSKFLKEIVVNYQTERPPWQLAQEILPKLVADGHVTCRSSAWLLHYANREFVEGVKQMKKLAKMNTGDPSEECTMFGHTSGITLLSNGVMGDSRVFRVDCKDWIAMFNQQLILEVWSHQAWICEGVDVIQRSALERLKKQGWNSVRPALATVVRGWYMRAFFDYQLQKIPHIAVERLKRILELLHWGRRVWREVPEDLRGVIFHDTFVRRVKATYLEALMGAYKHATDVNKKAFLDTLFIAANEFLEEIRQAVAMDQRPSSTKPLEPGYISAFYIYPVAQAYAALGYYYVQMARSSYIEREKEMYYMSAISQYRQAAKTVPVDDEKHCWYLYCLIEPCLQARVPKDGIMKLIHAIRDAMPKMQRIWENSTFAKQGRDVKIEMAVRRVEQMLK